MVIKHNVKVFADYVVRYGCYILRIVIVKAMNDSFFSKFKVR